MSATVWDILQLSIFRGSELVSGAQGKDRLVDSVGIMDHFELAAKNNHIFPKMKYLQHKLILSMYFVTFSPEQQTQCLRFLDRAGASGLLIYRSGMLEGAVVPEAFATADELGFPVIQLPQDYYSYSNVITAVTKAVMQSSETGAAFFTPVLKRIARLPEDLRTADNVVGIITESTGFHIGLYDRDLRLLHASGPAALFSHPIYTQLLQSRPSSGSFSGEDGMEYHFLLDRSLYASDMLSYVAILSDHGPVTEADCRQVLELIQLFYTIWSKPVRTTGALGRAILGGELLLARSMARSLGVDMEKLQFLAVCLPTQPFQEGEQTSLTAGLESFLSENHLKFITDAFESGIAVFLEKPHFSCNLTALLEEFAQTLPEPVKTRPAFFLLALPSPSAARDIYADCVRFAGYARQIFPRKQVFSHHQLPFVRAAVQTSQEPPEALGQVMSVLEPLQQFSQMDLLNTLAVYLLDTNGSLEQTAGLLFLHKSTAKYRLRRANEALGFDIRQMPENYSLCFALAVGRLLE